LLNCPCGVPEHGKWERVCRDVALKCVLVLVHVDADEMNPFDLAMHLRQQGHLNDARIAPCCPKGKHGHWWLQDPTEADRLPRQVLALQVKLQVHRPDRLCPPTRLVRQPTVDVDAECDER